jgi:DNA (cytosine-5)-methyltransferase 1
MTYYNDIDPNACEWLRDMIAAGLIANGIVECRSITEIKANELKQYTQCHFFAGIGGWALALRMSGWPDDEPVWTGSCPCQPISVAGLRKGHADKRHLWPAFHALIAECQPPTLFGEQVAGKNGREWMSAVRADLEGSGYAVGATDLCATAFGIPQHRERLFFACARRTTAAGRNQAGLRNWRPKKMEANRQYADWRKSCEARVLDDGLPGGVAKVLIRGFGNAIVPQVASEFICAFVECANSRIS